MIPSLDLGVVVLTNAEEGAAFDAITHHVLDHYLDAPPHDWLSAHVSVDARRDSVRTQRMLTSTVARDTTSRPSLQLSEYADVYTDPWYGDVRVEPAGDGLAIRFSRTPALVGELEHWQHDTFLVRWHDRELRADAFITFDLNPDGRIEAARMLPASPDVDFSYDFQDLELRPRSADPRRP